jgi:hypothetical protein
LRIILLTFAVATVSSQDLLFAALIFWLWIGGGNLLIGIPRFRWFLRETLSSAPRKV